MGLFEKFKGAAGELAQDAKDKVSDMTGVDTDKLLEAAGSVLDATHSLSDAADSIDEGKLNH